MTVPFEEQIREAADGPAVAFTAADVESRAHRKARRHRMTFAAACIVFVLVGMWAMVAGLGDDSDQTPASGSDDALLAHWNDELTGDRWVVTVLAAVAAPDQSPWYDFEPDGTFVAFDGCDSHEGRWSVRPQDEHLATLDVEVTAPMQRSTCRGSSTDLRLPTDPGTDDPTSKPSGSIPIWLDDARLGIDVPAMTNDDTMAWIMDRFDRIGSAIDPSELPMGGEGNLYGSGVDGYLQLQPGNRLGISTNRGCRHSSGWSQDGDRYDLDIPLTLADACDDIAGYLDQRYVRLRVDGHLLWVMTDQAVVPMSRWAPAMREGLPDDTGSTRSVPDPSVEPTSGSD